VRPGIGAISLSPDGERMPDVLKRNGLLISGTLLADTNMIDIDRLTDNPQVMVHYVAPGSEAAAAGLYPYDHILTANGKTVNGITDLRQIIDRTNGSALRLEIVRFGGTHNRFTEHVLAELPVYSRETIGFNMQPVERVAGR
jgi:S1-C subfamily serine protease